MQFTIENEFLCIICANLMMSYIVLVLFFFFTEKLTVLLNLQLF